MAKSPNFISQISSKLRTGVPHLTSDSETIVILDSQGKASHKLTVENIRSSDWGYIYERYVGLNYESRGWSVSYRGLEQQFSDQGIDLIITKTQQIKYMQCKYTDGVRRFGKQRIETILYEASTYLSKQYKGKKLNFALVVPSIEKTLTDRMKTYFLSKNTAQDKVVLELIEIPMELPIYSL